MLKKLDAYLDVVTAIANPIRWNSRINLAEDAIREWLKEPQVRVTIVEATYGERDHELDHLAEEFPGRVFHVPMVSTTTAWIKECLLNLGVHRLPGDAKYVAILDADIHFRKKGWANETLHALQLFPIVQPWTTAYDLGPNDEHIQTHRSFCSLYANGKPVVATGPNFWEFDGGYYDYAHSGFAWAYTLDFLERVGGLLEIGLMGSGDHHMALACVGAAQLSIPGGATPEYRDAVMRWQERALLHGNRKLGFVHGTIEHMFHGRKMSRKYVSRWDMFVKHQYNPLTDIKRNRWGVLEFAGNKPDLERDWVKYLRDREEDVNTLT